MMGKPFEQLEELQGANSGQTQGNLEATTQQKICHVTWNQRLGTPSDDINQINLKIWADAADKICFGRI